jgi:hypothetical protein
MVRVFHWIVVGALVVGLNGGLAMAQGFRDAGAKIRGEFGTGFYSTPTTPNGYYRSAPVYQWTPAPQMVQPAPVMMPAAPQVAQIPGERRSYSVEPSTGAQPQSTQQPARIVRRYSYEPAPVYRAPARQNRASMPSYLLPKADPHRYGS